MSDSPSRADRGLLERTRVPLTVAALAICTVGLYYYFFYVQKIEYLSNRNARIVATLADQIRRSIDSAADYVQQAGKFPAANDDVAALFKYDKGAPPGWRNPAAVFNDIEPCLDPGKSAWATANSTGTNQHRYAERRGSSVVIHYEAVIEPATDRSLFGNCKKLRSLVRGDVDLEKLVQPIVEQSGANVFDTVFLLDGAGNVIFQRVRGGAEVPGSGLTVLRLDELTEHRPFVKDKSVKVSQLATSSRQTDISLVGTNYQLFSVPFRSTVHVFEGARDASAENSAAAYTWTMCGLVRDSEFRSRALSISITLVMICVASILLVIFSWPFLKLTLMSAHHKVTVVDVVILGLCSILAASVLWLIALDIFTYENLEAVADRQLEQFAATVEGSFKLEIDHAIRQIDALEPWLIAQRASAPDPQRHGDLLRYANFGEGPGPAELNFKGPGAVDIHNHPFFQGVALLDGRGSQSYKWFVDSHPTVLIDVPNRTYFSAPKFNTRDYILYRADKVTIDSIRATTTGTAELDISRRTSPSTQQKSSDPVIVFVPAAISVLNAIVPPDFAFAIIDQNGSVLFHSEKQKNTVENLFAEADQSRQLRALVDARQAESLNIRYWGDDYRAFVRPLHDLPWTIVTLRDKRGLRTLNTEALIVTLMFLFVLLGPGLLSIISIILIVRPQYRATWAWPDPARVDDYKELVVLLVLLLVSACALLFVLSNVALLVLPFWFAPLPLVVSYQRLRPGWRRGAEDGKSTAALLASVGLICCGAISSWRGTSAYWAYRGVALVAIALIIGVVLRSSWRGRRSEQDVTSDRRAMLPLVYAAVAFLLLVGISVVPTTAFFKAAYGIDMNSYVKWVQMKLARDLTARAWRIDADYADDSTHGGALKSALRDARWTSDLDIYDNCVYDTTVHDLRPKDGALTRGVNRDRISADGFPADEDLPEYLEQMLPHYSEESTRLRELVHHGASDDRWKWVQGRDSKLVFTTTSARDDRSFQIASRSPNIVAGFHWASPDAPHLSGSGFELDRFLFRAGSILAVLIIMYAIAWFISRHVFLVDVVSPVWLSGGVLGLRHVICYPCDPKSAKNLFMTFARIDVADPSAADLVRTAPQSFKNKEMCVLVDGLDWDSVKGEGAEAVRGLIERLTRNSDRVVVIRPAHISVIMPGLLQGQPSEGWAKLLSTFVWVSGRQLTTEGPALLTVTIPQRPAENADAVTQTGRTSPGRVTRALAWLAGAFPLLEQIQDHKRVVRRLIDAETQNDPYLRILTQGLETAVAGRDQLLDEIGERAETYYEVLWRTCSTNEKIVLLQVAQTGLVNDKARKDFRRLLARGLIVRDPRVRMMNESFRQFVVAAASNVEVASEIESTLVSDTWLRFRAPFFASVGLIVIFFVSTQRELFDATSAIVTGLTASLPILAKMFTLFGDRRVGSSK